MNTEFVLGHKKYSRYCMLVGTKLNSMDRINARVVSTEVMYLKKLCMCVFQPNYNIPVLNIIMHVDFVINLILSEFKSHKPYNYKNCIFISVIIVLETSSSFPRYG